MWYLCPIYAPAPRSFFVFNQRLVCVVRATAEKAGEECWPAFSVDSSEVERDRKKIGYKKGLKFHIIRTPIWLSTDPAWPAPIDAAEDV